MSLFFGRIVLLTGALIQITIISSPGVAQEVNSISREAYVLRRAAADPPAKAVEKINEAALTIADYERMVAADPTDAISFNNLGVRYTEAGRLSDAITAFKKALDL